MAKFYQMFNYMAHVVPNISGITSNLDLRLKFKTCNKKLNKKKES